LVTKLEQMFRLWPRTQHPCASDESRSTVCGIRDYVDKSTAAE